MSKKATKFWMDKNKTEGAVDLGFFHVCYRRYGERPNHDPAGDDEYYPFEDGEIDELIKSDVCDQFEGATGIHSVTIKEKRKQLKKRPNFDSAKSEYFVNVNGMAFKKK